MSEPDDDTRPVSVAELLARNGTLGAPVGGHRRRRRGNPSAVSVAELTGEIPIVRTGEIPAVSGDEKPEDAAVEEVAEEVAVEESVEEVAAEEVAGEVAAEETADEVASDQALVEEVVVAETISHNAVVSHDAVVETVEVTETAETVVVYAGESVDSAAQTEIRADVTAPPKSGDPLPRRSSRPERSHDPRPQRRLSAFVSRGRASGAEQMNYDPVDESVSLAELVGDPVGDAEQLRSYLRASSGALFSGETVADDLARRGVSTESREIAKPAAPKPASAKDTRPRESSLTSLRHAAVAVVQSVLAVLFGAGLFIGFDQLWRWNNIVALVLSVLVILGLVVAVRVVRKTEDIASTLIAVAVGALVTLGPLALLQST